MVRATCVTFLEKGTVEFPAALVTSTVIAVIIHCDYHPLLLLQTPKFEYRSLHEKQYIYI